MRGVAHYKAVRRESPSAAIWIRTCWFLADTAQACWTHRAAGLIPSPAVAVQILNARCAPGEAGGESAPGRATCTLSPLAPHTSAAAANPAGAIGSFPAAVPSATMHPVLVPPLLMLTCAPPKTAAADINPPPSPHTVMEVRAEGLCKRTDRTAEGSERIRVQHVWFDGAAQLAG